MHSYHHGPRSIFLRCCTTILITTKLNKNCPFTTIFGILVTKSISYQLVFLFSHVIYLVVVSGMQLLRLRSTIRRHHLPHRAVLSQICCCFGERKVVLFQILLDGAEPRDAGTT